MEELTSNLLVLHASRKWQKKEMGGRYYVSKMDYSVWTQFFDCKACWYEQGKAFFFIAIVALIIRSVGEATNIIDSDEENISVVDLTGMFIGWIISNIFSLDFFFVYRIISFAECFSVTIKEY